MAKISILKRYILKIEETLMETETKKYREIINVYNDKGEILHVITSSYAISGLTKFIQDRATEGPRVSLSANNILYILNINSYDELLDLGYPIKTAHQFNNIFDLFKILWEYSESNQLYLERLSKEIKLPTYSYTNDDSQYRDLYKII